MKKQPEAAKLWVAQTVKEGAVSYLFVARGILDALCRNGQKGVAYMGDWYLEIDFPVLVVIVSAIITLILQLLLCFKARKRVVKLLPIALLMGFTIAFSVCSASVNGWDGLGYLFFALLSFGLLLVCGLGWGIWAIARKEN